MSEHLRIPLVQSTEAATNRRITETIQRLGHALPCRIQSIVGPIAVVTIEVEGFNFPPITCPVHQSQYIREPFQPGDGGVVFPCSVYIGNVSGLGGGTSDFTEPTNLSALVFFPVGDKAFVNVDADKVVIKGPAGVQTGQLSGGARIIQDTTGITITGGDLIVEGISFLKHVHKDTQRGGDHSGIPIEGP